MFPNARDGKFPEFFWEKSGSGPGKWHSGMHTSISYPPGNGASLVSFFLLLLLKALASSPLLSGVLSCALIFSGIKLYIFWNSVTRMSMT